MHEASFWNQWVQAKHKNLSRQSISLQLPFTSFCQSFRCSYHFADMAWVLKSWNDVTEYLFFDSGGCGMTPVSLKSEPNLIFLWEGAKEKQLFLNANLALVHHTGDECTVLNFWKCRGWGCSSIENSSITYAVYVSQHKLQDINSIIPNWTKQAYKIPNVTETILVFDITFFFNFLLSYQGNGAYSRRSSCCFHTDIFKDRKE